MFNHTISNYQKESSAETVSIATFQNTMKSQHSTPPPPQLEFKNRRFPEPGTRELIHVRRDLHQRRTTICVTFICSQFSRLNLKQHNWLSVRIHTLSNHKEQMKKETDGAVTALSSHIFQSHVVFNENVRHCVDLCVTCDCVCVWVVRACVCVLLVDMCTQPLFLECEQCLWWTWRNLPNSEDYVDGFHGFGGGGRGLHTHSWKQWEKPRGCFQRSSVSFLECCHYHIKKVAYHKNTTSIHPSSILVGWCQSQLTLCLWTVGGSLSSHIWGEHANSTQDDWLFILLFIKDNVGI